MAKEKNKLTIEFVPNIFDMGLFRATMTSRRRLRVTTAIVVASVGILFGVMGYFVRYVSQWPLLNIIIFISIFVLVIPTSYLLSLTIGDAIFPGPWLEKMRRGDRFVPERIEDQKAILKNKNIYFIFVWVGCLVGLIWGYDFATGGTLAWYRESGSLTSSMKSDDLSDRRAVLKTLSNPLSQRAWENAEVRAELVRLLSDGEAEIVAQAAYICGRAQLVEASDELTRVVTSHRDDGARAEAAVALGRIGWKPARGPMLTVLKSTFDADPSNAVFLPSLIYAFTVLDEPSASTAIIDILERCLTSNLCHQETLKYAFFYLKSLRIARSTPVSFAYFDNKAVDANLKCWAVDTLRFTASKRDVTDMKRRYNETPQEVQCGDVFRKYHSEAPIHMFENDVMRALFVRAIGNQMDRNDYDWIYAVGANEQENPYARKVAEIYIRAMNEKFANAAR